MRSALSSLIAESNFGLWKGLIDDSLPTTTRHKLESVQTFDGMVREVREMELEKVGQTSLSVERKCGQVHQVTAQPGPDSQSSGLTKLTQAVQ